METESYDEKLSRKDSETPTLWRRTRPIWIWTVIGIAIGVILFVIAWGSESADVGVFTQSRIGGRHQMLSTAGLPLLMPVVGFFIGLMRFLWKIRRE